MNRLQITLSVHKKSQIELEAAVRAVDELSTLLGTITSDTTRSRLTGQMRALYFEIERLEKPPNRPAGWICKETGQNFTDVLDVASYLIETQKIPLK